MSLIASVLVGLCICLVGAVAQWPVRADARLALLDAIAAARLTRKDVYTALDYTQSHWSKIERGELPLPSLDRLEAKLPPAVWDELLPRLAYVVWQRRQHLSDEKRSA